MFDTHCHLNISFSVEEVENEINKSREKRVGYILIPGTNISDSKKALRISQLYENIYAAVGIHPNEKLSLSNISENIRRLTELVESSAKVVAIGEFGFDFYRNINPESVQREYFKQQVLLALKYDKAIVIHNRHATETIIKELKQFGYDNLEKRLVFHCCEPDLCLVGLAKNYNFFIGVDGDITYDRDKQSFIGKVPLDNLVLETDSPFLTPKVHGKRVSSRNSPQNLYLIAKLVADIKKTTLNEVVQKTTNNALHLFGLT